jgi:hypothetical protein
LSSVVTSKVGSHGSRDPFRFTGFVILLTFDRPTCPTSERDSTGVCRGRISSFSGLQSKSGCAAPRVSWSKDAMSMDCEVQYVLTGPAIIPALPLATTSAVTDEEGELKLFARRGLPNTSLWFDALEAWGWICWETEKMRCHMSFADHLR